MAESQSKGFYLVDYFMFIFVIVVSMSIGIFQGIYRKTDTTGSYLMADRKLQAVPTAISLLISFFSAVSILGNATETYFYGVNYFFIVLSYMLAALLVAYVFVPMLYPLKLTSVNEVSVLNYIYILYILNACSRMKK